MIGATPGMADDDRTRSRIRKHLGRNVAGIGAGGLRAAILRPDRERICPACLGGEGRNQGRRRANQEIGLGGHRGRARKHRIKFAERGLEAVHFPVAGDQGPDHVGHGTIPGSIRVQFRVLFSVQR